ncbi:MAG: hypothetical protein PWQ37_2784 [Candidatus Petromonas sp.]|nr:hypothetical protein [Candidatus Petromonas sp.]
MPRLPTPKIAAAEVAKPNDETEDRKNIFLSMMFKAISRRSIAEKKSEKEGEKDERNPNSYRKETRTNSLRAQQVSIRAYKDI